MAAIRFKIINTFGDFLKRLPGSSELSGTKFGNGDIVYCQDNHQLYRVGSMGDYSKGAIVLLPEEELVVPNTDYDDSLIYRVGNKFYYWNNGEFVDLVPEPPKVDFSTLVKNSLSDVTEEQEISTDLTLGGKTTAEGELELVASSGLTVGCSATFNGSFEISRNSTYNIANDIYTSGAGSSKKIIINRPLYLGSSEYFFNSSGKGVLNDLTISTLNLGDLTAKAKTEAGDYLRITYDATSDETVGVLTTKDIAAKISDAPSGKRLASEAAVSEAISSIVITEDKLDPGLMNKVEQGGPIVKPSTEATTEQDRQKFLVDTSDNDILKYYNGSAWVPVVVAWG